MSYHSASPGPVILLSALDWGLGHATRCIPIIRLLEQRGAQVLLAGSGASGSLLKEAFPHLGYHELPAHTVRYARTGRALLWKILLQLPALARNVEAEKEWLQRFLQQQRVDAIISDNRYGLHHPSVPSVFISHQLGIRTPFGSVGNGLLRRFHYRLIGRFSECWIPDGTAPGLAGALSHPGALPSIRTRYIGPLSRFSGPLPGGAPYDLAIVLSGPEPQRSIWEKDLLRQLENYNGKTLFIRGLPGSTDLPAAPAGVTIVPHLPPVEMSAALSTAALVLARCGYSTVMDLAALRRPSILVPTPGQTEQEYLAAHLSANGFAFCTSQKGFDLQKAMNAASHYRYQLPQQTGSAALEAAIHDLFARIRQ
jgi:hypothetical protein